ncbi:MAG: NAD(P)/FAD-dependent oxidoreductase [Fimbriimonadales bacterium]
MTTTLILGGGFGGLGTADELCNARLRDHRIIVIDQSPVFTIGATKAWVLMGEKEPSEVMHSRTKLRDRGVEFVQATIRSIDPATRSVDTDHGRFKGDDLVIALGADLRMAAIPGMAEVAHQFYSLEGATELCQALENFDSGRVVILIPRTPFKCPAGPYEAALLLSDHLRGKNDTTLTLVTIEAAPMATGGAEAGGLLRAQLAESGIEYLTQRKTTSVDFRTKSVLFEDGDPVPFDLLIAVPPHEAPAVVRESGLSGPNGWIPVDPSTCAVADHPGIYAVGDVNVLPLPGRFKPDVPLVMPKAGVVAEAQGRVVARNIIHRLGLGDPAEFDGRGSCYLEIGHDRTIFAEGAFFDLPHPSMRPRMANSAQLDEKKTWVAETLRRLLG